MQKRRPCLAPPDLTLALALALAFAFRTMAVVMAAGPLQWQSVGHTGRRYRILALDGHGGSALFVARMLERLEVRRPTGLDHRAPSSRHCLCSIPTFATVSHLPPPLHQDAQPGLLDSFELIAATSGAAPVAILLGLGYRPSEILRVLSYELPTVLSQAPLPLGGNIGRWVRRWLYRPFSCRFTSAPRLALFQRLFGKAKLSDLHRHVLLTAFRIDPAYPLPEEMDSIPEGQGRRRSMGAAVHSNSWHPVIFSNLPRDCSGAGPDGSLSLVDAAMRATATPTYCPIYQVG